MTAKRLALILPWLLAAGPAAAQDLTASAAPRALAMPADPLTLPDAFAPQVAAFLADRICAATLRAQGSIAAAAPAAGLTAVEPPAGGLPNLFEGAALFSAPSRDGAVYLFADPGTPRECHIAIALAPGHAGALLAGILAAPPLAMRLTIDEPYGEAARFQRLTSGDGKVYADIIAHHAPLGGPAPFASVYVKIGAN